MGIQLTIRKRTIKIEISTKYYHPQERKRRS
jgi:hypothetical protein